MSFTLSPCHDAAQGVIGPGGVQWMTAGRGIVHSEMPKVTEGNLWGFQLWINLPKKDKMVKPRYKFNTEKSKMVKPRYKFNVKKTKWSETDKSPCICTAGCITALVL